MRVKLMLGIFAVTVWAPNAVAQVPDVDIDLVPDAFDNCVEIPNGPGEAPNNQVDADGDGFGNACDADFDQSGYVGLTDFNALWVCTTGTCPSPGVFAVFDLNSDGVVNSTDLAVLYTQIGRPFDGVSGLACADPTLVTTLIGGTDPVCN